MVEIRLRAESIIMDFEAVRFHIPAVIVATDRQLAAEWSGEPDAPPMNRSVEGADRRKLIPLSDCKSVAQASRLIGDKKANFGRLFYGNN